VIVNARVRKPAQSARRRPAAEPEAITDDRQVQVALAAYFIAEKRGFEPGHELDDWLAAEAQLAAAEQPSVTKAIEPVKAESIS
jgi:hypothetical protein